MEHYITPTEFFLLLSVFWVPVFAIGALVQWRLILRSTVAPVGIYLLAALTLEFVLAFAFWISPLHGLFLSSSKFPEGLEFGSVPFQAGVLATILVTGCIWTVGQRHRAN